MKMRTLVSRWVPVVTWMLLIFAGSSDVLSAEHTSRFIVPFLRWFDPQISFAAIAAIHLTLRKLGHLTEYDGGIDNLLDVCAEKKSGAGGIDCAAGLNAFAFFDLRFTICH